jgi:hypothetical protein
MEMISVTNDLKASSREGTGGGLFTSFISTSSVVLEEDEDEDEEDEEDEEEEEEEEEEEGDNSAESFIGRNASANKIAALALD